MQDWNTLQPSGVQLFERFAFLGIMGDQIERPLKPLEHKGTVILKNLRGKLGPRYAERSYIACRTADVFFSSLEKCTARTF